MKAIKGNKEYDIDEKQKNSYLESGYDIKNDKGEVIAYGRGKTVPYEKYEALEEENKVLKEKIKELEKAIPEENTDEKPETNTKQAKK